ncbi:MAG: hypothetical protein HOE90_06640 [Bacteriovoracaceae bacterium]|jgi:hypothetical protein|nr:hypothetical protein [Bacteriovoracaceae bacterium]
MSSIIKSFIIKLLIVVTLVPCFYSNNAQALVAGIATGGTISTPIIIAALSAPATGFAVGATLDLTTGEECLCNGTSILTVFGTLIGILILDENVSEIEFSRIETAEEAALLDVSIDDAKVFNSEIFELNAIKQTVTKKSNELKNPTLKKINEFWKSYEEMLSPQTLLVASKISNKLAQSLEDNTL